jgi:enediyne biosynthesis protein E4
MIAVVPMKRFVFVFVLSLFAGFCFCQPAKPRFKLHPAAQSGVAFANTLTENDTLNILNKANIYNGGGVGIGDFNNDGLQDVYFAGNMVSNKLYLNKGAFSFTDITDASGTGGAGRWCTGVSVVDINNDGWQDIYVSASFRSDATRRTNLLYINSGIGADGLPHFKESAKAYGLADTGFSTQAVFFDYDKDGDLDMYLVTNELYDPKTPIIYRPKVKDGSAKNTDRLYRNNGNATFTNVSRAAGILIEGWGHAVCVSDFNLDGWSDIYVANDFISNDLLYINNRNGTFSDRLGEFFKHTGWNAMGTDAVDINNDGFVDLISLEMLPESNLRKKTMLRGDEYFNYFNSKRYNYTHQYVRNVLQINSGAAPGGQPVFSDVAFMAGVYQTDWSWAPLIADFDGDGFRDIIITNGLPRDVTDLDYVAYNNGQGGSGGKFSLSMVDSLPIVRIPNYAFRNEGGITFQNITTDWGLNESSFSNGGAYADLDNDGDLDFVVNNINSEAFVYENAATPVANFLQISFKGSEKNKGGFGATVTIWYAGGKRQYYEHQPCRGYLSTHDSRAHFGLGAAASVDSVRVIWPDAKTQLLTALPAGKALVLDYAAAAGSKAVPAAASTLFVQTVQTSDIKFLHRERDAIDYNIQPTLPHKMSQYGPGIAVADIDGNGTDDFYMAGSPGNPGVFYLQDKGGRFAKDSTRMPAAEIGNAEEMGVLFFDADGDGDQDLYIACGGYEFPRNHASAQDRLYTNNGKGFFERAPAALPKELSNASCVRAADFDRDGDLDLFVGGRSVSGAYPLIPESYLLQNEGGVFKDVTLQYCPELKYGGMITDVLWSDFDGDGMPDLVVAGEWMPVSFYRNKGTGFDPVVTSGISEHSGWWNSLAAADFDSDGDIDYVAGNLGLNANFKATAKEPMTLLAKDLDENGKTDLAIFCYLRAEDGSRKPFPMHAKDDMISQLNSIRKTYPTFRSYGFASMDELWPQGARQDAIQLTATNMQSCFIENKGNGRFVLQPLPLEAQTAPVYGIVPTDADNDGNLDLVLTGNDYGMEPGSGRHDAFNGLLLKGDGKNNFAAVPPARAGFWVTGDGKALATLQGAGGNEIYLASQNSDSLKAYSKDSHGGKWLLLQPGDFYAEITSRDNRKRKLEFYYGASFLSQSTRRLLLRSNDAEVIITDFKGTKRKVAL